MITALQNSIAIVTGGSRGYGRGIAASLHAAGARVWITGRDETSLAATARELGVEMIRADATVPADWDRMVETVLRAAGRIDILVNNAGGGVKIAPLAEQTDESITAALALNLLGPLYGCRRIAPIMTRQKAGTIVNISSVCSRHSWPGWSVYSAAKAGLDQAAKSLYLELRPHGVRVTTLVPSWGATEFMQAAHIGTRDPALDRQCIQPEDIGRVVVEICERPAHLCQLEVVLLPLVQEINPL